MSKKKITAPLTYNPGKGRPKEHLAYLNYQEMQALRRLNGDNMERGPRGLPSFPPADAKGSSSKASSSKTSSTSSKSTGSGSIGSKGGGASTQRPGAGSSKTGTGSGVVSTRSGYGGGGGGGKSVSSQSGGSATRSTRSTGAAPRSISGIGSPTDRSVKSAVESRSISSAQKTPALKSDQSKTGGASVRGAPSEIRSVPGVKVTGAIKAVRDARVGETQPVVTMSQYAQPAGYSTTFNTKNSVNALKDVIKSQIGFGNSPFTKDMDKMVRHLAGEVGTSGVGAGQVAQVMINRSLVNNYAKQFGLPKYKNDLSNKKQWASTENAAYKAAKPGSAVYARVVDRALSELMSGVPAPNATDFRAVNQAKGVKTKKTGIDVAGNRFGNFEGVSEGQMRNLRSALSGTSTFGIPVGIGQEQSTPTTARPAGRTAIKGLISYPKLDRPVANKITPTAEQVISGPSYRPYDIRGTAPAARAPKQITDRVLAEPAYRPYGMNAPAPAAIRPNLPPIYDRISEDPTNTGRFSKQIYDRLAQEPPPQGKQIYDRVPQEIALSAPQYRPYDIRVAESGVRGIPAPQSIGAPTPLVRTSYSPPTPPPGSRYARIANDPTLIGKPDVPPPRMPSPRLIDERISEDPTLAGRATKRFYDRIAPEGIEKILSVEDVPPVMSNRYAGPFVISEEDPESLRYKKATTYLPYVTGKRPQALLTPSLDVGDEEYTADGSPPPSQANPPPSQEEQSAELKDQKEKVKKQWDKVAIVGKIQGVFLPGAGYLTKKQVEAEKKKIDAMSEAEFNAYMDRMNQRREAQLHGESSDRSGGIYDIIPTSGEPFSTPTTTTPPSSPPPVEASTGRPYSHYEWDLGFNVPSPSDPKYTEYQKYLAERRAAYSNIGMV